MTEYRWFQGEDFEKYCPKEGHKGKHWQYSIVSNCNCFLKKEERRQTSQIKVMLSVYSVKHNEVGMEKRETNADMLLALQQELLKISSCNVKQSLEIISLSPRCGIT